MKWFKCILALLLILGAVAPDVASADRGRGHGHSHRHGGRAHFGLFIGAPLYWNWPSPYYAYPPDVCFAGPRPPEGVDCREFDTLTVWQGVRNLGVLLVAAVAASVWSFRRRDVP